MRNPEFYTTQQAARLFEVTTRTIRYWVRSNRFPGAIRLDPTGYNPRILIPKEDIAAELTRQNAKRQDNGRTHRPIAA